MRSVLLLFLLFSGVNLMSQNHEEVRRTLAGALDHSREFAKKVGEEGFEKYATEQTPIVSVLSCSDSRVHLGNIFDELNNRVFTLEDAGNQLAPLMGTFQFSANVLKVKLAMVIGHSDCGAIKAAMGDTSGLPANPEDIKYTVKEISTIVVDKSKSLEDNTVLNVRNQVEKIKKMYPDLEVVGAISDFANSYGKGFGALIIVDVNGEGDPQKIKESPLLKGQNPIVLD